jgi:Putative undecaprenyl diphosphate synthase
MPKSSVQPGLTHVVVCGGTPREWHDMSVDQWEERVRAVARAAAAEGAHWVTLLPHHGPALSSEEDTHLRDVLRSVPRMSEVSVLHGTRFEWKKDSSLSVIVETSADGQARFASTIEGLRLSGVNPDDVDEDDVSRAVLAPADEEPDLVVVLGPADMIPESMVWELAYSELVFIDLEWGKFEASHLELAIDDFNRRHRRFGGLDS